MHGGIEELYQELKLTGHLPSPNGVGLALMQLAGKGDASIDAVVQILRNDPTLTGRMLKVANSAAYAGAQPATTAREASMRLGLKAVCNVALGFSLVTGHRRGRCAAFDYEDYWSHSLATAIAAQHVAELTGGVEPSEAFTCGLLSGIGRLALASVHPEEYGRVLELARGQSSERLAEIESEHLGTQHRDLAALMLRDWKLPESFVQAVTLVGSGAAADELPQPASARLARTLQGARDLSRTMTTPPDADAETCRRRLRELAELSQRLGLDAQGFTALWERCVAEWKEWGRSMNVNAELRLPLEQLRRRAVAKDPAVPARESESESESATRVSRSVAPSAPTGLNVLLVGTDAATTRLYSTHLGQDGHRVRIAAHGEGALAMALEHMPHVLVTGWDLPGMSGLDLVRTLRQGALGARVHVILLAGREEERRILEAFENGVDEYLLRPCDPRVLQARVRAAQRVVTLDEQVQELVREREDQLGKLTIATRKLQKAAVTDTLTGLPNRRHAMQSLQQELETSRRSGRPLSVFMIDIDHFKSVNDQHGHDVGDLVLREVAGVLRGALRGSDLVCRLGGEEFLALCPGANLAQASQVAERLRSLCAERVIEGGGFGRAVTVSMGVAQLEPDMDGIDALVKRADERVYLAKQGGRNRVVSEDGPAAGRRAG